MLVTYEKWLRTDRTMKRINQLNKEVTTTEKGMQDGGVYAHMRDLRTLFKARRYYNNEDIGIIKIKHYPFFKYKIGAPTKTRKRNISGEQIIILKNCVVEPGGRAELARDLFMLSFYMCGMNAADFYNLDHYDPQSTRLKYNRSKTTGTRDDDAFISIKIDPEAGPLLEKYIGKLRKRYSTYNGLDTALSKGMKLLRKETGIADITFYWARHTFATIARNKCKMDKDDIAEALNHVDGDHKITDIYIEKDWSVVDKVQTAVIKFFRELNQPKPANTVDSKANELFNSTEQRKAMRLVRA
jgi:integrase